MDLLNLVFWLAGTFIVVLSPIILLHELGHFVFAKLAGVRVEEFGLGYPPRLFTLGYGKGLMAIGPTRVTIPPNFKKPLGFREGATVDATAEQRKDNTYILRSARVIIEPDQEDQQYRCEQADGLTHVRGIVTLLEEGTRYSFNLLPLGGFTKMTGEEDPSDPRSVAAQPKVQRIAVLGGGIAVNIIAAILLFILAFMSGQPQQWWSQITDVAPGSPAESVGLAPGDIVIAADGQSMSSEVPNEAFIEFTQAHLGQEITLTVLREGEELVFRATPRTEWPPDQGPLGVSLQYTPSHPDIRRWSFREATSQAFEQIGTVVHAIVSLPFRAAAGATEPGEARPASVVAILEILVLSLKTSLDWGLWFPILQQAGLISLALGLTNLLPLPGLDGGRLVFVLIEVVRGHRVSPEREAAVHLVGILILVVLMMSMIVYDFVNPLVSWDVLKEWLK